MKKVFGLPFVLATLLISLYSCKKNDTNQFSFNLPSSKQDVIQNFEKYFVLINNISNYPDTVLFKKFIDYSGTDFEMNTFSKNLGFSSINQLNIELYTFCNNIMFAKKYYPEFFENNGQQIKQIARTTFKTFHNFYHVSFYSKEPYMIQPSENIKQRVTVACCPCTSAYNNTMDEIFWTAASQTEICAGLGLATGGIGGTLCMAGVLSQYYINKYYALKTWDDCVTNGPGF